MDIAERAPRNKCLKPEVDKELDDLATELILKVRFKVADPITGYTMTADRAMEIFNRRVAQIVRDPSCHIEDDREWSPVKCRRCGHKSSVPAGVWSNMVTSAVCGWILTSW